MNLLNYNEFAMAWDVQYGLSEQGETIMIGIFVALFSLLVFFWVRK